MKVKFFLMLVAFLPLTKLLNAQEQDSMRKVDIDQVVVKAFRVESKFSDMPHKVEVLKEHDIKSVPSENLTNMLKKTSSVDVIEYPSMKSKIGVRGFSPSAHGSAYTTILIDGLPAGTENPSTLGIENAKQVEILKGPFSSFYGSGAMAGIINIVTPESKGKIGGKVSAEYGSYNTSGLSGSIGGAISKKWNFDLTANYKNRGEDYKTGENNLLNLSSKEQSILGSDTKNARFEHTTYQKFNSRLRVGYEINKNWEIHSFTQLFRADDVYSNGTFWGVYGNLQKDFIRWGQSLKLEGEFGNHKLRISPYINNQNLTYYNEISDSNFVDTKKNYQSYGVVVQDAIKLGKHRLIAGIDNYSKRYNSSRWEDKETQAAPYKPDYLNMSTGVWLQAQLSFFDDKLKGSLGSRLDHVFLKLYNTEYMNHETGTEKQFVFNPNFGLQYKLLKNFKIHTSYGTAFKAPDAFQKAGSYSYTSSYGTSKYQGNPDLEPERSATFDAGIGFNNREIGVNADVTTFFTRHQNMIVYDYSNADYRSFKNADKAKMNGMELTLSYDLGAIANYKYSLEFYANITHLYERKVKLEEQFEEMKYVRRNNGNFGIQYRNFNGFNLRINARFIGNRYEDNWLSYYNVRTGLTEEDVLRHPEFMVVDFSGSYTFFNKYKVSVKVNNIFDEIYTEKDGYFMPGRMISGSLTYQF